MDPVRIHGGIILDDWFIAMGYIGPRRRPVIDSAIAFPTREGTNQTIKSSLFASKRQVQIYLSPALQRHDLPKSKTPINVESTAVAQLLFGMRKEQR